MNHRFPGEFLSTFRTPEIPMRIILYDSILVTFDKTSGSCLVVSVKQAPAFSAVNLDRMSLSRLSYSHRRFFWIFAQVSRRVTVRLKTSFLDVESGSTQK